MQTSTISMDDMIQEIKETMKHSFLDSRIDMPAIDNEKLFMLLSIMDYTTLPDHVKKRYIVTIMLIQAALDVHETIPSHDRSSQVPFTEEDQLTVLAGDYYSGLYYYILSEIDDHLMVRELATAIRDINEYKMALHYDLINTVDDFIEHIKHIETQLLTRMARYAGLPGFAHFAQEWVLVHELIKLKEAIDQRDVSLSFYAGSAFLKMPENNREWLVTKIDHYIRQSIKRLRQDLPCNLNQDIVDYQCCSAFYHDLIKHKQNKGEG